MESNVQIDPESIASDIAVELPTEMSQANKLYNEFFLKLPEDKRTTIRHMTDMFLWSHDAYVEFHNKSIDSAKRIFRAAVNAERVVAVFKYLMESTGRNEQDLIKIIQDTSDWLDRHNWIHIQSYINTNDQVVYPTAAGIIKDMRSFCEAASRLRQTLQDASTNRHGNRDDKSTDRNSDASCGRSSASGRMVA